MESRHMVWPACAEGGVRIVARGEAPAHLAERHRPHKDEQVDDRLSDDKLRRVMCLL